jgi:aminopeptidase N
MILTAILALLLQTQQPAAPAPPAADRPPTRADILRGEYGRYRANNDLLSYHLDVRIDPAAKTITGKNTIRFRMLSDDTRIQLDLYANLAVDKILLGTMPLKYSREINTVWVDFPHTLKKDAEVDGTVWRFHVRHRPGRTAVDLHGVRRRRRRDLVAEQRSVA